MNRLIQLTLFLLVVMLSVTAKAYDFEVNGIYYNTSGTNATVTYQYYSYEDSTDTYTSDYTGSVTIPETVTYNGTTYSVTSIGNSAFSGCSGLTSVTIPNSVTSIGSDAFSGCSGLTSVNIFSIEAWLNISFGDYSVNPLAYAHHLFLNGVEVKELVIPNSVTSIGDYAFVSCSGLTSVTIPNSVTSIGDYAFYGSSGLTSVTIGNSVTSIGLAAFSGCSALTSVTIPNSVTSIGNYAFYGCSGLTSVTIGNSVTSIGERAFRYCSGLTSVTIGNSVTSIGYEAFEGCRRLTSVNIFSIEAWLNISFGDYYANPLYYAHHLFLNGVEVKELVIPNSVTSIGDLAFSDCSGLTSVTIPNSVTSIGNEAFYGCSGLTSVTIGNSVTSIGSHAFSGCRGLTSVTIPNSVTSIGSCAFLVCSGLTSVTIGNSVTSIGSSAFYGCSGLTSVTIPNSVTSIGNEAFYGCSGLTSVTIGNSVTSIGNEAFYGCRGLTSVTIPNSVTSIGDYAFQGCSTLNTLKFNAKSCADFTSTAKAGPFYGLNLSTINIGDSVQRIPAYFANGMTNLTSITIPNSVTSIGDYAFEGYRGLTSVTIPNSVTYIGSGAFRGCSGLASVTIPNSVTYIGSYAFQGCSTLNTLKFNAKSCADFTLTWNAGPGPFYGLNLSTINIGDSVQRIPAYFAYGLTNLTSITIPNSVTSIGYEAFEGCSGLTSVTILNSVTSIGSKAFYGCSALTECYSYITNPSLVTMGISVFVKNPSNYADRTLYVPSGSKEAYQANSSWYPYFGSIVEMVPNILATSIELNQTAAEATVGGTLQLIATVLPDSTTNKVVTWSSSNPTIASVNENGLVTALAVGSATITAITTDGSNLSASCDVTVTEDLSNYDNYLSMEDTTVMHGETIVIPVKMTNEASIISFQTDIFLPDGFELLQEDGEYIIDPSERMTRTHSIMSNKVSNGAIRVLCYSSNYKPFTGNSGDDLFYLTVKVADDAEGDYTIQLKNTLLTNSDFVDLAAPDVSANVNVKAYLLGDANNSGTVSITDVVVTAQYVLELNPQPFVFEAADANADGNITVADVSRIAWMVLNPTLNAPLRAPALWNNGDRMSADGITLAAGETRRVSILLDNEMGYNAFQLDLNLPEGLTASNFQLTDRAGSHAFDVNMLQNGNIRALCYSPALTVINGHEGALLTFDVTAAGDVYGDILVDGIELVTADCQSVKLDAFTIGVNNASSVNESITGKAIAKVEYFNLAGQRMKQLSAGVTLVVTTYTDGSRTTTKIFN